MKKSDHPKTKSREFCFQFLFKSAEDLVNCSSEEIIKSKDQLAIDMTAFLDSLDYELDDFQFSFARDLIFDVVQDLPFLREQIEAHAIGWKLENMPTVDRTLLFNGIFELTHHKDTPRASVINDIVELGKQYSCEKSGKFLNSVLDKVAK